MSVFTPRSEANSASSHRSGLARLTDAVLTEWRSYSAMRTLRMLDDRALSDIGLSRAEIGHAVRHGRT